MHKRARSTRLAALETARQAETDAAAIVARLGPPMPHQEIGALVIELLHAKLAASHALAEGCAALMRDPRWLARQDPAGLAALAATLDSTAFALGDRLAQQPEGNTR